ncbi:Cellulose synthase-like protein G3 [Acorus gramineus]|uniref:Cellulose synthase-like protein G3 n=1 Tax=Acorus gramineus TaxID=55184 RepID=A0AAV9BDJ0_ACOGR|nr:Cellulose synthase-like protein G3 [Acorus gramineus]
MADTEETKALPLHTCHPDPLTSLTRTHALLHTCATLAVLHHRLRHLSPSLVHLPLLLSDLVLAFMWAFNQAFHARRVRRLTFPENLPRRGVRAHQWPSLDVFVCTADPRKEPPMGVVNTALSAMAFDYPAGKVNVYVSDDGGCRVTLLAFAEAARFARHWVPFCREVGVRERSPEAYFAAPRAHPNSVEIKAMYERMKEKVDRAMETGQEIAEMNGPDEHKTFSKWTADFTREDHPTVIQILLDSERDVDVVGHAMPSLIYVSREKRPCVHHHFKAGALNALTRVSATMTNAPIILTLDCDMNCNDPQAPQRALCHFLDPDAPPNLAYVQFPQHFRGMDENDIYGCEWKGPFQINPIGMDGLRGPDFEGTGCFFRRRALHREPLLLNSKERDRNIDASNLDMAHRVTRCTYENGTKWGATMGFRYGSLVEDYFTGYRLLEVLFSKYNTIAFGVKNINLLMGMCYSHYAFWAFWSIPITTYAFLPQLALLIGVPMFPKDLFIFLRANGTIRRWWNNQRMWMIRGVTCFPLASIQFFFQNFGISGSTFNLTGKARHDDEQSDRYARGIFEFGTVSSPFFVSLATVAMINLVAFWVGLVRAVLEEGYFDSMFVQVVLCGFVVVNCWPVYEAMVVRKDGGRLPGEVKRVSFFMALVIFAIAYLVSSM